MDQYLIFAILGLGAGAVSAALGVGLVMTYKGAGVINFAHAALAIWGAFAFDELRATGDLVLPLVIIPSRIPLGGPMPVWVAMLVSIVLAAAIGAAVQLLVFRPLRHAPLIAKIIASLGLLTLFQSLLTHNFGRNSRSEPPLFPASQVHLGELVFPADRLWIAGLVLVLAAVVAVIYRRTLFGLATRAGLEDEAALTLSRWSPTTLATVNVAAGVAITSTVMIASASISPLNPQTVQLLVIPGLTVMLVGRLVNVIPAAAAGLLLGMLQGVLAFLATKTWWPTWLASGGITAAVPLIVIVVMLVVRGQGLPTRGGVLLERLPRVPEPMRLRSIAIFGVVVAVSATLISPALRLGLTTSMIFAVLALSLVVVVGLVGQISLGQLAIAGIAAFILTKYMASWPFPLGLLLSSACAAVFAMIIGLPALRVRGAQLAVVTIAVAAAVQGLVLNNAASGATSAYLTPPKIGPLELAVQSGRIIARIEFTLAVLVVLLSVAAATSLIIGGRLGRRFLAVRSNEQASASIGIDVARTKVLAFGIAGFIAGLGGGLLAYSNQAVSASAFDVFISISLLVYAYIGGITSVGGALYAGIIAPAGILYVAITERWNIGSDYLTAAAIGLIVTAIVYPNGAADAVRVVIDKARRRFRPAGPASTEVVALPEAEVSAPTPAALTARDVTVRYGGVTAVDGVCLDLAPGEIVGLIGPNGAGKTSLLDALTGFAPAEGSVALGERTLTDSPPHVRYHAGLGRTWQSGQLFEDLNVYDNVRAAFTTTTANTSGHEHKWRWLRWRAGERPHAAAAMRLLGITSLAHKRPAEISGGQRKLVGLARALAGQPSVLLADEPAAGLDSIESQDLGERLKSVARTGVGVLLIEHDLALVLGISDRVYVLEQGRVIAVGTPDHIRQDPAVLRAYIGEAGMPQEAV